MRMWEMQTLEPTIGFGSPSIWRNNEISLMLCWHTFSQGVSAGKHSAALHSVLKKMR